jgi:hypothetical protein
MELEKRGQTARNLFSLGSARKGAGRRYGPSGSTMRQLRSSAKLCLSSMIEAAVSFVPPKLSDATRIGTMGCCTRNYLHKAALNHEHIFDMKQFQPTRHQQQAIEAKLNYFLGAEEYDRLFSGFEILRFDRNIHGLRRRRG